MNNLMDGKLFASLLLSGANNLINNKNKIDALNVFPVPDGDTGTNMSNTIQAAIKTLESNPTKNLGDLSAQVAKDMLFGARGNSGVILSQIFKGFSLGFANVESVDVFGLLKGFQEATKKAYGSVLKPIEGTLLTVIRETTENLEKAINNQTTFEEFFNLAVNFARKSCNETPNKLKILREVNVTDSGGEGLFTIIYGMQQAILGNPIAISNEVVEVDKFLSDTEVYEGEFGYCTEFIVELDDFAKFDKVAFEKALSKKANSLVVVQDNEILKVHGHVERPGDLLNFGQKYGELLKIKSENMTRQANESKNKNVNQNKLNNDATLVNECGIVSCNLGSGLIQKMKDLGADFVIESGQTQNPSAQEIYDAINAVNAKNVFILPNNSNIFMAAQQAAQAINDKNVFIIPTKSQLQGLIATQYFDHSVNAKTNEEILLDLIQLVSTGEITQAVRDTKIDGIKIKKDNFIAILDGKIKNANKSVIDCAKELIDLVYKNNPELQQITIYTGVDANSNETDEIEAYIRSQYEIEVEIYAGQQPNYPYLIGFE
ncbi:DAK2 domain-containing protein [Mycoplasmopsis gallinarum]|uniref:DAK2 domain-containing protein n=1 Tax=Mycoplasmopsis gallinarum TaxID=29557 RepID=UPI000487C947|nr:DAK2 domain-containing protein [Mycoplasmopsis gallinarum]